MNTSNPLTRVANGEPVLTKEEMVEFLRKRAALRAAHGEGPEARAAILRDFEVTPEEVLHLLNQHLWFLWLGQETDEQLMERYEEQVK